MVKALTWKLGGNLCLLHSVQVVFCLSCIFFGVSIVSNLCRIKGGGFFAYLPWRMICISCFVAFH